RELARRGLEVLGERAALREDRGIVRRQAVLRDEALTPLARQLRQASADPRDPRAIDLEGDEVRLGEVPVVVRVLLRAHRARQAAVGVPEARLLHDALALRESLGLAP